MNIDDGVNYRLLGGVLLVVLAAIGWPLLWPGESPIVMPQISPSDALPLATSLAVGSETAEAIDAQIGPAMSWRVLAAAYADQDKALETLSSLRHDGFAAYPESSSDTAIDTPYRIYVEDFLSLAEASELVGTLKQRYNLPAEPMQRSRSLP